MGRILTAIGHPWGRALPGLFLPLAALMVCGCAGKELGPVVAFYGLDYKGEHYRIRSVESREEGLGFNELISRSFVAVDYGQDGFIDAVTLGDITVAEAQERYEAVLETLAREGKLRQVAPRGKVYQHQDAAYFYEIRTFCPSGKECFNQFRVAKDRRALEPEMTVAVDHNADGTIDAVTKGTIPLGEVQSLYSQVLQKGLEKKRLVAMEGKIVVR